MSEMRFSVLREVITEAIAQATETGMDDRTRDEWVAICVGASGWLRDHDAALTAKVIDEAVKRLTTTVPVTHDGYASVEELEAALRNE